MHPMESKVSTIGTWTVSLIPETALDVRGIRRAAVITGIKQWMNDFGDSPDFDAGELLDAPLTILRGAHAEGAGAAGLVAWY